MASIQIIAAVVLVLAVTSLQLGKTDEQFNVESEQWDANVTAESPEITSGFKQKIIMYRGLLFCILIISFHFKD